MKKRRDYFVSTSSDTQSEYYPQYPADSTKKYCVKCERYGFKYQPLGERIYKDEELINGQLPHDSANWLQCYRCGTITRVAHGKAEGSLTGFTDVAGQGDSLDIMIEPFVKSRSKSLQRSKNNKQEKDKPVLGAIEDDKDIQQLTKKSGREVSHYSDSIS